MIKLSFKLKRHRKFAGSQREWNDWIREAFTEAGKMWIEEFLPLHFEPGAVQRYNYTARTLRTLRRKKKLAERRGEQPAPLVLWGEMRKDVLGRPISAYNIRATATRNTQKVRIPVRIPHPLNPKNKGELTRVTHDELDQLRKFILAHVKAKAQSINVVEEKTIAG